MAEKSALCDIVMSFGTCNPPRTVSAAPTPPELLERLREITGIENWEDLARDLGVPVRRLMRWKNEGVEPDWEHTLMLLHRAGYLADGDGAADLARQRQQLRELEKLRASAERLEARLAER